MEEIIQRFGWKKVAATLVIVSILGLIFVFVSFYRVDERALDISKKNSTHKDEIESTQPTISSEPAQKTYLTSYYSISYPSSFTSQTLTPESGIENVLFLSNESKHISITISVYNAKNRTKNSLSAPFEALGYTREDKAFGSNSADVFAGSIKGNNLKERVAVFNKDKNVLVVHLVDTIGNNDEELDNLFTEIVTSIQ